MIELLRSGQSVRFIARGASMWPNIPPGSRLEVRPCPATELKVGELAAFERHSQLVVHRITGLTPVSVRLQGDNSERSDGELRPEQVLGRAMVVERRRLHLRWPRPGELRRAGRALLRRLLPRLSRLSRLSRPSHRGAR
ncbi:MAG: hypothetical protein RL033_6975 [Pseudomonadota bacterium]|jgi:hypothetical protein